ncbi:MAG TPA: NAD(P)H-quinone dehydrogenase [Mycobacteriales bacterium]|jgi:dihydrolipoamide dehydrogenase|nr:NAD(P)H-quinone dehydrogenase [Mycobacteriales bacterium]
MTRVAILGGGPGGYEAALVAAQLGADVVVVDRDGLGGACVLADCVPSKTLIATSESMTSFACSEPLGVRLRSGAQPEEEVTADLARVNARVKALALAQSLDIARRVAREGVRVVRGSGRIVAPHRLVAETADGDEQYDADVILVATGGSPRTLPGSEPDGERILSWQQLYDLPQLPEHLVVVGSGVTGAEFASAYLALGSKVTLVSSRDRVLPSEDADAALLIEDVFGRRGMRIVKRSRAAGVSRTADGIVVKLEDGGTVEGSHCLVAVGAVPNTRGLGLEDVGVALDERGYVQVDGVSRTTVPGIYAAGDCTGVLLLASVAAMQGRIAMWHALGDAVTPLRLGHVAANVFTDPEIATVGLGQATVENDRAAGVREVKLPLGTNARAKMQGVLDGFVKLYCRPGTGTVLGGVVVAPRASELILPVSIAVQNSLSVDQLAQTFTIYPSISGSITEAARQLHLATKD